jgi:N6-L-threonylcarbamoyladenine synthase
MEPPFSDAVLGIETSCDETATAVYSGAHGLMSQQLHSQARMHAEYGGVVPELAARDHILRLPLLTQTALREAFGDALRVTAVAYTAGPGLIGALLTGAAFATGLAAAWEVPVIPVHHLEGHLLAACLTEPKPAFPFLALLVSGGHSMLVRADGVGRYRVIGESLDDAAGEAFDKTAKLLGLPYPGGPALAALAEQGREGAFTFPEPLVRKPGFDFSFSGLKTAVAVALPAQADAQTRADVARAFEVTAVAHLTRRVTRALEAERLERLVIAGGVGANRRLRQQLSALCARRGVATFFPPPLLCTDNAAMIAYAGWCRRSEAQPAVSPMVARARWPLESLEPPP